MKREVKFSLVFRDMWQSAGKYVPRVDQLVKVAPAIIEMGCFARVETNGGGFEQVNLLFGENPNKAVREWTKPFHEAGIQTHMLDRARNGLRISSFAFGNARIHGVIYCSRTFSFGMHWIPSS